MKNLFLRIKSFVMFVKEGMGWKLIILNIYGAWLLTMIGATLAAIRYMALWIHHIGIHTVIDAVLVVGNIWELNNEPLNFLWTFI